MTSSPGDRCPPSCINEYSVTPCMLKALSVEQKSKLEGGSPVEGVLNSMVMLFQVEKAADVISIIRHTTPSNEGAILPLPCPI